MINKRGLEDKKGVSAIVATLIIVLLVIVAAGIVWIVIKNIVEGSAEQIELQQKCLEVDLEYVSIADADFSGCEPGLGYKVTLKRTTGGDEISGVAVVLLNATDSGEPQEFGAIGELGTKTANICGGVEDATKMEFTAYFEDSEGNPVYCQINEKEF